MLPLRGGKGLPRAEGTLHGAAAPLHAATPLYTLRQQPYTARQRPYTRQRRFTRCEAALHAPSGPSTAPKAPALLLGLATEDGDVDVALGVLTDIVEEHLGTVEGSVETVVERRIVHEEAEGAVGLAELLGSGLNIGEGTVDLLHGGIDVDGRKVVGELLGVVEHTVGLAHECWHLAVEVCHESVELARGGGEVGGDALCMMEGACDGRIGQESVDAHENGIELRQHLLDSGQKGCGACHEALSLRAGDGVAFMKKPHPRPLPRREGSIVGGEHEVHADVAHEIALDGGGSADGEVHLIVEGEGNDDVALTGVVELNALDESYLIAVGKDGVVGSEAVDIAEPGIVDVLLGEERDAFQKVHSEEEDGDGGNGDESDFDFFFHWWVWEVWELMRINGN